MPRYSQDEKAIVIEMARAFISSTTDKKIKGKLANILRRTEQSFEEQARKNAEKEARKQS